MLAKVTQKNVTPIFLFFLFKIHFGQIYSNCLQPVSFVKFAVIYKSWAAPTISYTIVSILKFPIRYENNCLCTLTMPSPRFIFRISLGNLFTNRFLVFVFFMHKSAICLARKSNILPTIIFTKFSILTNYSMGGRLIKNTLHYKIYAESFSDCKI